LVLVEEVAGVVQLAVVVLERFMVAVVAEDHQVVLVHKAA
jgi:hypothetical protein